MGNSGNPARRFSGACVCLTTRHRDAGGHNHENGKADEEVGDGAEGGGGRFVGGHGAGTPSCLDVYGGFAGLNRRRALTTTNEDSLASMGRECDHSGAFDDWEMNRTKCCPNTTICALPAGEWGVISQ